MNSWAGIVLLAILHLTVAFQRALAHTVVVILTFCVYFLCVFSGFPCQLCPPGSYNNITRATTCSCCPAGYTSTYAKNGCRACHLREWAEEGTFPFCGQCKTCVTPSQCELNLAY
jgi:hypothetical protein